MPLKATNKNVGRGTQLLATLERMGRQKLQQKMVTLLEVIVPLIFALLMVAVCQSFMNTGGYYNTINYDQIAIMRHPFAFSLFACYPDDYGDPIPGLLSCSTLTDNSSLIECFYDTPGVPFNNLCMFKLRDGYSSDQMIYYFINSMLGNTVSIYDLDNLIILQWLYRGNQYYSSGTGNVLNLVTEALSSVGLGNAPYTRFDSVERSGYLYFAPAANVPEDLIAYFNNSGQFFKYVYGGTFDTVEEAEEHVKSGVTFNWGIIVINSGDLLTDFDVEIRLNGTALPRLKNIVVDYFSGDTLYDSVDMYLTSGFIQLQKILYSYVLEKGQLYGQFNRNYDSFNQLLTVVSFPALPFKSSLITQQAGPAIPFVMVMAFIFTFTQMVQRLVHDKEIRIREATLIMGLKSTPLYLSYFIVHMLQITFTMILITIIISAGISPSCDPFTLFLFLFIFGLTLVPLAGLIASFFNNSRLATLAAPLIYFIMSLLIFILNFTDGKTKLGISIFSPACICSFLTTFFQFSVGTGFRPVDINNMYLDPIPKYYLAMLTADFFIYTILMLYFDAVIPSTYGTTRHPLFFITSPIKFLHRKCKACCCCREDDESVDEKKPDPRRRSGSMSPHQSLLLSENTAGGSLRQSVSHSFGFGASSANYSIVTDAYRNPDGAYDDEEQYARKRIIEVDGMVKTYTRGGKEFNAVDHLTWSANQNEISVLLGPNGAGKSTLVNILTGMTSPTEGRCIMNGHNIETDMPMIRRTLGFCPQHNILWCNLSCREHLEYFGKVKGLYGPELEDAIVRILEEVKLSDKMDVMARALSGGQKRKLSVAIAFIGNNQLVILDEPTAGMDSSARRATWRLLRYMSSRCSILLTTHYMDEADLLGDRIAIIDRGRLQCCGPALLLKSHHGQGYTLRIELQNERYNEILIAKVQQLIKASKLINSNGREIQFGIPKDKVRQMPKALNALQRLKEEGEDGIEGFSVSASTLEEVFLSVIKKPEDTEDSINAENCSLEIIWQATRTSHAIPRGFQQFWGLIRKRFFCALRDRKMQFFQIVFPFLVILLSMLLQLVNNSNLVTVEISTDMYRDGPIEVVSSYAWKFLGNLEGVTDVDENSYFVSNMSFLTAGNLYSYFNYTAESHAMPRYFGYQGFDSNYMAALRADFASLATDANDMPIPLYQYYFTNAPLIMYNTSSPHSGAVGLHVFFKALFQNSKYPSRPNTLKTFRLVNKPMPKGVEKSSSSAVLVGLIAVIPFMFVPASPIAWVVSEKACKARHLQRIYGTRTLLYWLSNFVFDMFCYVITVALCTIVFVIFQRTEFIGRATIGPFLLNAALYGINSTLCVYCFGFLFKEYTVAQQLTMLIFFVTGFLLVVIVLLFSLDVSSSTISDILRWPFRIFPSFSFCEVVMNLASRSYYFYGRTLWSLDTVGYPCIYMAAEIPLFIIIILVVENPFRPRIGRALSRCLCCFRRKLLRSECPVSSEEVKHLDGEDWDVMNERLAVYEMYKNTHKKKKGRKEKKKTVQFDDSFQKQTIRGKDSFDGLPYLEQADSRQIATQDLIYEKADDVVQLVDLRKVYGSKKIAVRSLSFSVPSTGVFAFLGTNGAGKTTSLSILCQEQLPSNGDAYISGYNTVKDSKKAMKCVGYCPQFDATLDLLTVEEHLTVYADILCISFKYKKQVIEKLLHACQLAKYKKVLSKDLSGGNRRKLSVACALIGAPTLLCLDEPSAGMDPVARRGLWDTISVIANYCAVMLTTHHLEEVEALANRVTIMSGGKLRCIGSLSHLKDAYGCGYEICINVEKKKKKKKRHDQKHPNELRSIATRPQTSRSTYSSHEPAEEDEEEEEEEEQLSSFSEEEQDENKIKGVDNEEDPILRFMKRKLPNCKLLELFRQERYVFSITPDSNDLDFNLASGLTRSPATVTHGQSTMRNRQETDVMDEQEGSIFVDCPISFNPPHEVNNNNNSNSNSKSTQLQSSRRGGYKSFLAEVFKLLLKHQEELHISHFSVSQASIEQVFLRFCDEDEALQGTQRITKEQKAELKKKQKEHKNEIKRRKKEKKEENKQKKAAKNENRDSPEKQKDIVTPNKPNPKKVGLSLLPEETNEDNDLFHVDIVSPSVAANTENNRSASVYSKKRSTSLSVGDLQANMYNSHSNYTPIKATSKPPIPQHRARKSRQKKGNRPQEQDTEADHILNDILSEGYDSPVLHVDSNGSLPPFGPPTVPPPLPLAGTPHPVDTSHSQKHTDELYSDRDS